MGAGLPISLLQICEEIIISTITGIICKNCGKRTHTSTCGKYFYAGYPLGLHTDKCFVAIEDGKWIKGCAYEEADEFEKWWVDTKFINKSKGQIE